MEETLERGLSRLFGGAVEGDAMVAQPGDTPGAEGAPIAAGAAMSPAVTDLIRQAQDHYQRALDAQRAGDWTTYGDEIAQVGTLLQRLRELMGRQ
jgi:uncharacterized membrane protein (UPF0182 family)